MNNEQLNTENQDQVQAIENETDPTNLAEALQQVKQQKQSMANGDMGDRKNTKQNQSIPSTESDASRETDKQPEEDRSKDKQSNTSDTSTAVQSERSAGLGTTTTQSEVFNPEPIQQAILDNVKKQSIEEVTREFKEQNFVPMTWDNITIRNEKTGEIEYMNPDTKYKKPFNSRVEAAQWLESVNKQLEQHYQKKCQARQNERIQQIKPLLDVYSIIPEYTKLNKVEKLLMDNYIQGYELKTEDGQIYGYSCDLNVALQKAKNAAKDLNLNESTSQQQTSNQANNAPINNDELPATDMKSSGSSPAPDTEEEKEPTNLSEALAQYKKKKREEGE